MPANLVTYAATYMKGIYKSENGGKSWYPIDVDQKEIHTYFKRLFRAPRDPDNLYVTTSGGGLFQINFEMARLEAVLGFKDQYVNSLAFTPPKQTVDDARILAGTGEKGVFEAHNPGKDFQQFNAGLVYREVNTLITRGDEIYAGTVQGIFRWNTKPGRWNDFSGGIKNKNILSLCAPPNTDLIYAGSGVFDGKRGRFEDVPSLYRIKAGKSWEPLDAGLPEGTIVYSIVTNPKHAARVYLGTSNGVYRSMNGGNDWSDVNKGLGKGLKVFKIEIVNMEDGTDVICIATSRGVFMANDTDKIIWLGRSYGLPQTAITDILLAK